MRRAGYEVRSKSRSSSVPLNGATLHSKDYGVNPVVSKYAYKALAYSCVWRSDDAETVFCGFALSLQDEQGNDETDVVNHAALSV